MKVPKYIVGIDEAGRGPLAGPVAVGAVMIAKDFEKEFRKMLREIKGKDSKKLKPSEREVWFGKMQKLKKEGKINFCVTMVSSEIIDERGLSFAIKKAIRNCLDKLEKECKKVDIRQEWQILLDGSLKAGEEFLNQKTIIKGDEKEPIISLASIAAKVTRDRFMVKISKQKEFEKYKFDIHKGYGTKMHRELIEKHGLSRIHRKSFCS